MEPYQERLIAEYSHLVRRTRVLSLRLKAGPLLTEDDFLMDAQCHAMQNYIRILELRGKHAGILDDMLKAVDDHEQ